MRQAYNSLRLIYVERTSTCCMNWVTRKGAKAGYFRQKARSRTTAYYATYRQRCDGEE